MTELEELLCRIAERWAGEPSGLIVWSRSNEHEERLPEQLRGKALIHYRRKDMLDTANNCEEVKLSTSGRSSWYSVKSRA